MVVFGFLPKVLGGGGDLQIMAYSKMNDVLVVETIIGGWELKPYWLLKFLKFMHSQAVKCKTSGASPRTYYKPPGETFTT